MGFGRGAALVAGWEVPWRDLLRRGAEIAGVSAALSAWLFVPLLLGRAAIHVSRWEPAWKWDSFGHEAVLAYLVAGRLFDAGRRSVLTLLALAGRLFTARRRVARAERVVALGLLVFLALFSDGRPGARCCRSSASPRASTCTA